MGNQGSAIVNFGATPSMEATTTVSGQTGILSTSKAESWIMEAVTSNNNASNHRFGGVSFRFTCGIPVNDVGFTIYVTCLAGAATGQFEICWVWN